MRPTLADIAREAGVSAATVDRVVNDRPGVSPRTRARVLETARRVGYLPSFPVEAGEPPAPVRLAVLLPAGTNAFIAALHRQFDLQAAALPGVTVRIERPDGLDPAGLAGRLSGLDGAVDGVAVVALDHPLVREAVRSLAAAGMPVVTLASDIPGVPRLAYVGVDNGQAGRLAGYVTGRLLGPGTAAEVALFAGTLAYRGHQEREMGFRQVLAEDFPRLGIIELRETREDRETAHAEMSGLLARHPRLAAVYNAGGATAGIARALADAGAARRVVFVAHEATEDNKALLLDGTLDAVIDQDARLEVRETLAALVHAARGSAHRIRPPRLQLILRENLPVE